MWWTFATCGGEDATGLPEAAREVEGTGGANRRLWSSGRQSGNGWTARRSCAGDLTTMEG
jgi:hypothetical protein